MTALAVIIPSGQITAPSVSAAILLRINTSSSSPAAASAPSVFTDMPMADPATNGSSVCGQIWVKKPGSTTSSITAHTTTSAETIIGTTGLARTAPPVATDADTPQIEIPDPKTAAVFLGSLKIRRAIT